MGPFFKSWLVEFSNGFADRAFFEDLLLFNHANEESGGTQAVNLPWDALGVIVNAGEGIVGEKRSRLVA